MPRWFPSTDISSLQSHSLGSAVTAGFAGFCFTSVFVVSIPANGSSKLLFPNDAFMFVLSNVLILGNGMFEVHPFAAYPSAYERIERDRKEPCRPRVLLPQP